MKHTFTIPENHRIIASDIFIDNNSFHTQLNNNDLIIGPSGAGKTRGYVLPNILLGNESFIVVDTKNSLCEETGAILREKGYVIENINFSNIKKSTIGYNPFDMISYDTESGTYSQSDIMALTKVFCPTEDFNDQFWDNSARQVLNSMISYILEELPQEEHNMQSLLTLISGNNMKTYERLLDELALINPTSPAVTHFSVLKNTGSAEKTYSSIVCVLSEKILQFAYDIPLKLSVMEHRIDFSTLGNKKTAIFINVSDTDRAADQIISLFYTQALQSLCHVADESPAKRLNIPVRIILDDFAAGTLVPDFDKITSVIRSRNISVSIILQSISQLESGYRNAEATTIINNCDHILYLGGHDIQTINMMSLKAGKTRDTITNLPIDMALVIARGSRSRLCKKFDVSLMLHDSE